MPFVDKKVLAVTILIFLLTLTACQPTSQSLRDNSITADISGLELDESQVPTLVFKRPGAPSLGTYKRFIIDPVQVRYDDPKMKELKPEEIGRMQLSFLDAMLTELYDGGYEVGTRSEAETLRISLTISGLKAPSAESNIAVLAAPINVSVGEVTVEAVFRDALTNRIDAVVVDRSQGSRVFNPTPWSNWADVEATFHKWAKGIRKAIDQEHGR